MRLAFALCLLLAPATPAAELFRDDFSKFPPRVFSELIKGLNNAIQEYHYLPHRGLSRIKQAAGHYAARPGARLLHPGAEAQPKS